MPSLKLSILKCFPMDCLTLQKGEPVLYQWKTDSPSVFSLYQYSCIAVCQSLAKLLHGTAALASILFGQAACRDPRLTLGPFTHTHALDSSPWSHQPTSQHKLLWSTVSPAIQCLPLICPLDKALQATYQNPALSVTIGQSSPSLGTTHGLW